MPSPLRAAIASSQPPVLTLIDSELRSTMVGVGGGGGGGGGVPSFRFVLTLLEALRAEDFFIAVRRPVDLRPALFFRAVVFRAAVFRLVVFRPVVFRLADFRLADFRGAALRAAFRATVFLPVVFRPVVFRPIGFRPCPFAFFRPLFLAAISTSPLDEGILLSCDYPPAAECGEPVPES